MADRDGHEDDDQVEDDDYAINDNIRESLIDYLSRLAPHARVGVCLNMSCVLKGC